MNAKTKVKIICPLHGVFLQTPDKHLHCTKACPVCAGNRRATTALFIEKAKHVHGDKFDYSQVNYVNGKTRVSIVCPVHGVFTQMPNNHLSGKGCPYCANNVRLSYDDFVEKARDVHGCRYDYSLVKYVNNHTPVEIVCRQHGSFMQTPYVHLSGSGCPVCSRISQVRRRNEADIQAKAIATFIEHYGVTNPMFSNEVRKHHKEVLNLPEVREKANETKRKNGSFNTSEPEILLGKMLVSVFGKDDVRPNYKSDVYPFRCDYFIVSRQLYIELNAHWSHGGHWYRDGDVIVSDTFSVRDVKKRLTAMRNKLNYVVFWTCDLSDARDWFDRGCPDGHDWSVEYSWRK